MPFKQYRDADCLQDIIDNVVQIERYVEGDDQIDTDIVWNVVSERLPRLKADAARALEGLAGNPGDPKRAT